MIFEQLFSMIATELNYNHLYVHKINVMEVKNNIKWIKMKRDDASELYDMGNLTIIKYHVNYEFFPFVL